MSFGAVAARVVLAAGEEGAHHQAVGVGLAQEGRLAELELLVAVHLLDPGGELELGELDVDAASLERLLADLGDLDRSAGGSDDLPLELEPLREPGLGQELLGALGVVLGAVDVRVRPVADREGVAALRGRAHAEEDRRG